MTVGKRKKMRTVLYLVGALSAAALDPDDWKFLAAYPKHYTVHKLTFTDVINIDGKLDDPAWADAAWTSDFVDITRHTQSSRNLVPAAFQTRVKLRWDPDYLYVGAELRDRFVYANITGHNQVAPYHDNDFEFFVDPSGSSQFYKVSARNIARMIAV